jgi:hypothetical protein
MVYGMTSGQQTVINHHYKNTKDKLLKTNGAACFDKSADLNMQCLKKQ